MRESYLAEIRRERCRRSIKLFCETYLPHHFYSPFGEHHLDLLSSLEQPSKNAKRIVRAISREHGKSALCLIAIPLWFLAYRLKNFVILFGSSHGAIVPHFSAMQQELDTSTGNSLLLSDFPHLSPQRDFKGQYVKWDDHRIKLSSSATIEARSIHSKFRGLKEGQYRPDLMIVDDPQDEEEISTFYRRDKLLRRFRNTILNLGTATCDILVEGNFMHKESLVGTLLKDHLWDGKLYMSENLDIDRSQIEHIIGNTKTDGSPLWPEVWPMERLRRKQAEIGARSYALEFLNREQSEEEMIYNSAKFMRFDRVDFLQGDLSEFKCVAYWDPIAGKKTNVRSSDFAAITVLFTREIKLSEAEKPVRYYWIVECWMARASPEAQCSQALVLLERYPISALYYEDNGGYATMVPYLKKVAEDKGIGLPLKCLTQTKNKIQRILNMESVVKNRTYFASQLHRLYLDQWDEFPDASHDDGPDSTVGGLEQFERKRSFMFSG